MKTITHRKIEKRILIIISEVINKKYNNEIFSFPNVTAVDLSLNKSNLKIYFTFSAFPQQSLKKISFIKGLIKKVLANQAQLRRIPNIDLLIDESFEKASRIEKILENIKKNN